MLLQLLFNIELQVLARAIRQVGTQKTCKRKSLFADDMTFYIGILRNPQKNTANWIKAGFIDQCNKTERPEINPDIIWSINFIKDIMMIQWGKE